MIEIINIVISFIYISPFIEEMQHKLLYNKGITCTGCFNGYRHGHKTGQQGNSVK